MIEMPGIKQVDRTVKEQVSVSKQTQGAARGHYIQGSGEKA